MIQIYILFHLISVAFGNSDTSDKPDIFILQKQSHLFQTIGTQKIFIDDGAVLGAKMRGQDLIVVAKKAGSSKILIGKHSYHVHVLKPMDYSYHLKLKSLVEEMRGISYDYENGCSILKGRLLRFADLTRIAQVLRFMKNESCDNSFRNEVFIDPLLESQVEGFFQDLFTTNNLYPVTYSTKPFIQMTINEKDRPLYHERLKSYGFLLQKDPHSLTQVPNVETEIIVTELRKKEFNQWGIQWPSQLEVQVSQKNIEALPFNLNLNAIEENGHGRILASPKILSASGKEADFLAGGEIPIRTSGFGNSKVSWKNYGIILKVLPSVDSQKRIRLKLSVEVSMVDAGNKVNGLPGFLTNKMSSEFLIKENQVLILSGLIKEDQAKNLQGLPGLIHIPVLGKLFGSEDFQNNKTELVILVRPRLVEVH